MNLDDLTKEELVAYIRQRHFTQPTQRDILGLRWERLTREANATMERANAESQKYIGKKDIESYRLWSEWQNVFTKGLKQSDEAEKIFNEMSKLKNE